MGGLSHEVVRNKTEVDVVLFYWSPFEPYTMNTPTSPEIQQQSIDLRDQLQHECLNCENLRSLL